MQPQITTNKLGQVKAISIYKPTPDSHPQKERGWAQDQAGLAGWLELQGGLGGETTSFLDEQVPGPPHSTAQHAAPQHQAPASRPSAKPEPRGHEEETRPILLLEQNLERLQGPMRLWFSSAVRAAASLLCWHHSPQPRLPTRFLFRTRDFDSRPCC